MNIHRRRLLRTTLALASGLVAVPTLQAKEPSMYGLIGRMTAKSGQRDALAAVLLEGLRDMPGCLSYIVAFDPSDADALWITEAWDNQESHDASLRLPSVQAAISKGRPMIAGFGPSTVTTPIGGHGLAT